VRLCLTSVAIEFDAEMGRSLGGNSTFIPVHYSTVEGF
jgi:hypothetical protein